MADYGAVNVDDVRRIREIRDVRRRRKKYLERLNIFRKYDDVHFRNRYRFTKENARKVIELVRPNLYESEDNRGLSISIETQVLTALRYYARSGYQDNTADLHNISQASVSRIITNVSVAIAGLAPRYVRFPREEKRMTTARKFYDIARFPQVIGAIDGTHIPITNPGGELAQIYINRKGWYSLNVQVISDASFQILDIVARWRGSAHDSRIFNESRIKERFEQHEFGRFILLGDSGYGVHKYLLTPLRNPETRQERVYNTCHKKTRNVVERCFGCWKGRFRCLTKNIGTRLGTAKNIIVACAVLHNLAVIWKEEMEGELS
ncbi:hypothetical protein ANN_25328 [Periplaneta americana]|uniref:Putative nuclease HARBI1 n=1 Tax=Periplaneta americana TaxID=6978 RepID=A0ABQ8S121_PERAM|nr:hypothetical protein ANN_25328 [Periplaneta americana]